jgi:predicted Zn-dependent protease with MMP-like domain
MNLFKKSKDRALTERQVEKAGTIADRILKRQRKVADYLNHVTAGISRQHWIFLLVSFCLAFGTYCLLLLVQAFN